MHTCLQAHRWRSEWKKRIWYFHVECLNVFRAYYTLIIIFLFWRLTFRFFIFSIYFFLFIVQYCSLIFHSLFLFFALCLKVLFVCSRKRSSTHFCFIFFVIYLKCLFMFSLSVFPINMKTNQGCRKTETHKQLVQLNQKYV